MALIVRGTNENFQKALNNRNVDSADIRLPKSLRAFGNQDKIKNASILQKTGMLETSRNAPLFNDPRYTSSTLAIPTDERSLHGLYRFFAETDPIVGAALKVLTELPLAGLRLGICEDTGVQQHYEEQWERINGFNLANDAVAEYHEIGLATLFGSYNESDYMWDQFAILNPDYVKVESTWINATPLIKLIPDEALKKIVQTQSPRILYDQIPAEIRRYVLFNQEIPLDPNHTFLLTHAKRPYETKGRSVIKRILKILMLEDRFNQANFALATRHAVPFTVAKVGDPNLNWLPSDDDLKDVQEAISAFELDPNFCYDEETECLTKLGWKKYTELTYEDEIAAFNPETEGIQYEKPSFISIQDYEGDMVRFDRRGIDMKVTPNHRMLLKRDGNWLVDHAENVKGGDQFRTVISNYTFEKLNPVINIAGKDVDTEAFFELAGWFVAEGSTTYIKQYRTCYMLNIAQLKKEGRKQLKKLLKKLPWKFAIFNDHFQINNKDLANYFAENFGMGCENKQVPEWMRNVDKVYLQALLRGWLAGDGYSYFNQAGKTHTFIGCSSSKQLIDNMQEIAFKLGYYSRYKKYKIEKAKLPEHSEYVFFRKDNSPFLDMYYMTVSVDKKLGFPKLITQKIANPLPELEVDINVIKKGKRIDWDKVDLRDLFEKTKGKAAPIAKVLGISNGALILQLRKNGLFAFSGGNVTGNIEYIETLPKGVTKQYYKGKIWCVSVSTGIFVTRRNNKIAIQGNTYVTHPGFNIEYYGSNGRSMPVGPELDRIYRLKFIGLGVHEQLLAGQGGSYSSAYMSLEVQRQRYLNLQLKLEQLFHTGIFKPIAEVCGFYRVRQATAGYAGVTKIKYAKEDRLYQNIRNAYKAADYKNPDFIEFINRKTAEYKKEQAKTTREYVFPKLDFGALNAAYDENMKNYVKWMNDKYPELVDSGLIARLAKLDRDDQLKAKKNDLRRMQQWLAELQKEGLLDMYLQSTKKGGAGGGGDMGPIGMGTGGALNIDNIGGGGEPESPIGVGGAPETAEGTVAPAAPGGAAANEDSLKRLVFSDDVAVMKENKNLLKQRKNQ